MEYKLLSFEDELTLLGSWHLGRHREDVNYFEPEIFEYKKLFKGIKEGYTISQLKDKDLLEGIEYTQLINYGGIFEYYYSARSSALLCQRDNYAARIGRTEEKKSTKELTSKINEIQAIIDEVPFAPLTENFSSIFIDELKERQTENQPQYGKGFRYLDKYTKGIHRGELTVITARPGIGKSAMALQVASNVALQNYKSLFIPLEMTAYQTLERMLLQCKVVTIEELEKPNDIIEERIVDFLNYVEKQKNFNLCVGLNTLDGIKNKIKEIQPYVVIIDQLSQIKAVSNTKDIREKIVEITRELKAMAMEYNVAIILLAQLNRTSTRKKRPGIEELAESDSIGQDADNVFILYTDKDAEAISEDQRDTNLVIAKQRSGRSGSKITLRFIGDNMTFNQVDTFDNSIVI